MKSLKSNYSYESNPPIVPTASSPMTRERLEAKMSQYKLDRASSPPFAYDWHDKQFLWISHYRDFMLQYFG